MKSTDSCRNKKLKNKNIEFGKKVNRRYTKPEIRELGNLTLVTLGGTGGITGDSGNGTPYRYNF